MADEIQLIHPDEITYVTPRDLASIVFHHRALVLWTFSLIVGATLLYALFRGPRYESDMTILINLERTDPVVTADPNVVVQRMVPGITDQQVNSELQLLKSDDLLREVVTACGLQSLDDNSVLGSVKKWLDRMTGASGVGQDVKVAKAVRKLQNDLVVEIIPKSALIKVSYASPDPKLSVGVLRAVSDLYIKKHVAVRRPAGTFDFFKQEAERYQQQLRDAEKRLETFTRENHVASVDAERDATLKKLTDLEVTRHDTQATIAITTQRIRTLQGQMTQVPSRQTTQVRNASPRPPEQLQSALLTLELKRTELLGIFQPDYPPVQEIEKQIAEAKAALVASQEKAVVEETTDRDPAYEWLRAELEKAKVDRVDLESRERAITAMIAQFENKAKRMNELELSQSNLVRSIKVAEASYLAYQKKEEEARMSDALDQQRILNVAIADTPSVPILPTMLPTSIVLLIGLVSACLLSGAVAFGAERVNAVFRTPHEVKKLLQVPVVAAIPERLE